jgi:hypothetical protein
MDRQNVEFRAQDGHPLRGVLTVGNKIAGPVVVLTDHLGTDRYGLHTAQLLEGIGIGTLVFDLSDHGASKPPLTPERIADDIAAAVRFLQADIQAPDHAIGIAGSGVAATGVLAALTVLAVPAGAAVLYGPPIEGYVNLLTHLRAPTLLLVSQGDPLRDPLRAAAPLLPPSCLLLDVKEAGRFSEKGPTDESAHVSLVWFKDRLLHRPEEQGLTERRAG